MNWKAIEVAANPASLGNVPNAFDGRNETVEA